MSPNVCDIYKWIKSYFHSFLTDQSDTLHFRNVYISVVCSCTREHREKFMDSTQKGYGHLGGFKKQFAIGYAKLKMSLNGATADSNTLV